MTHIFFPERDTFTLTLSTASTVQQIISQPIQTSKSLRVYCEGGLAFIQFGKDGTVTAKADNKSIPIAPHAPEVFLIPPKITHIAAVTREGTAKLHLTLGDGV